MIQIHTNIAVSWLVDRHKVMEGACGRAGFEDPRGLKVMKLAVVKTTEVLEGAHLVGRMIEVEVVGLGAGLLALRNPCRYSAFLQMCFRYR